MGYNIFKKVFKEYIEMNEEWSMNIEERKKFWDTLCSLDGKDMQSDIKRLMDAMKFPRFLYRYRAVNDRTLST